MLEERGRRRFAAAEALAAGHGGIMAVSRITGVARSTIGRGLEQLRGGGRWISTGLAPRAWRGSQGADERGRDLAGRSARARRSGNSRRPAGSAVADPAAIRLARIKETTKFRQPVERRLSRDDGRGEFADALVPVASSRSGRESDCATSLFQSHAGRATAPIPKRSGTPRKTSTPAKRKARPCLTSTRRTEKTHRLTPLAPTTSEGCHASRRPAPADPHRALRSFRLQSATGALVVHRQQRLAN